MIGLCLENKSISWKLMTANIWVNCTTFSSWLYDKKNKDKRFYEIGKKMKSKGPREAN